MGKNRFNLIIFISSVFLFLSFLQPSQAQYSSSGFIDPNSPDAIAVRIVPNPNHYSIARWYESQGFQGSPQALLVDGYEAIRDGRTVYVNAANINQDSHTIYTNIYLISYNQDSAPNTVDILGQIVAHWKFNNNLTENYSPSCSISSLSCSSDADCPKDTACATTGVASSSCVLKAAKNCLVDADCPTNFFCNSLKSQIARDLQRVGRLEEMKEALFNFKKVNNHYPSLESGTYLAGNSVSVWPSWGQILLSNLAMPQSFTDPINRLGACPGYDAATCWDAVNKKFFADQSANSRSLKLPAGSYALAYSSDSNGSAYNLCAILESYSNDYSTSGYHFSPNDPADYLCPVAGVITGGKIVNTPPRLVDQSLVGEINQPFNGYIKVVDQENNPLSWILNTAANNWLAAGWSAAPILQDTTNPNQKKVYAQKAGQAGNYNITLTVNDGQGGVLSTSTPIKILSSMISIEADNGEYVASLASPFNYSFSFAGNSLSASSYSVNKISGPFDLLATLTSRQEIVDTIGSHKYKVTYSGNIPTVHKFYQDTDFKYNIQVNDGHGNAASKAFIITVKPENPILDFSCANAARINANYSCTLGPYQQSGYNLSYSAIGLLPGFYLTAFGSSQGLEGKSSSATSSHVQIKVVNNYGASSTRALDFKIDNYCGDGVKQAPNTEGRGGANNDGYEACDGSAGVTSLVASSSISVQYGCATTALTPRPYPILTTEECIFLSPAKGGGYCGDGYCQSKIGNTNMENCTNCFDDCCGTGSGNCTPNCDNKACGSDGCGGSCGVCGTKQTCSGGNCVNICTTKDDCNDLNPCTDDICNGGFCSHSDNNTNFAFCVGSTFYDACTASSSVPCSNGKCTVTPKKTCSGGKFGACVSTDPRLAYCVGKCEGQNDNCTNIGCTSVGSQCGACINTGNGSACLSGGNKVESKSCAAFLGWPSGSYYGNVYCYSDCSGYDTSSCTPNVCTSTNPDVPSGCYWYQVPESEDSHLTPGTTCMVKMNVDSNHHIICDNNEANGSAQWFKGSIAKDKGYDGKTNKVKICSVTGCTDTVNPNKCRYYNGLWSNHCYVHKTW